MCTHWAILYPWFETQYLNIPISRRLRTLIGGAAETLEAIDRGVQSLLAENDVIRAGRAMVFVGCLERVRLSLSRARLLYT
jgi:hypothetical protein